ncbi:O-antigen ligase family protein [Pseudomonas sichuanensis]|uniref:O-antigen ligase family protein n=1 Tax=Pseudomonas sichuanensis TaxID=2213015 RepID=UPI0024481301|nr:O-antigen ligase family protein [Pseudomonas sichuanensis]MDH0732679.1 O-antigen ligase family protein [Pseudomonas sichuanensis]MDH1584598.1 O-antigen ligase family protein [Pseudomonas sichuanensis]MDH1593074.1 O-antigen ligase family protein [Pseudomonas sichuanensis]MDH1600079.1 O-antigen ligase family protein [Pseudomonas sichuanensis]
MPEHFRALVVILFLATVVFVLARGPASDLIPERDFKRRRNLWFALTLLAFVSYSFWVYAGAAAVIMYLAGRRERNIMALFFMLLFVMPPATVPIPGFGVINYLFDLNHVRLLTLCVLLPAALALRRQADTPGFGRLWPDRLLAASIVLIGALYLRETTLTDTLRQALYLYIDVFLPYYVASRALREVSDFKDAMLAFVLAGFVLALIGVAEFVRHWLLYNALLEAMGVQWSMASYLSRGGSLRASVTTGQAIALGYVISVAIGLFLFVQGYVRSPLQRAMGALLLAAGLVAPLSRGPWIGAAIIVAVFIATGKGAVKRLSLLAVAGVLAIPLLTVVPGGEKVLDMLPFIGNLEKENITYRERLLDNSWIVIQRNPLFGSFDFRNTPEMQSMIQGDGIIDIVNTYLNLALRVGLVGLGLFVAFFVCVLRGVRKAMLAFPDKDDEQRQLGRALLATLVGILVIIFTVSSITVIPVVYWSVAGLSVAYMQMVRRLRAAQPAPLPQRGLQPR